MVYFKSSPNYEDPTDANTDNEYEITVQASDDTNDASLHVTVVVTNERRDGDELPVIIGTAQVGETLTVDTSPIGDTDENTTFYYAWYGTEGDTDTHIDGATNYSYTLTDDDEGKTIAVRVGFQTTEGRFRLTSEPTAVVTRLLTVSGITSTDYAEDGTGPAATFSVSDPEGSGLAWSLSGDDSDDFSIDAGVLRFITPPDHEAPVDSDTDNVYLVTVELSDGTNATASDLSIRVTNVEEP